MFNTASLDTSLLVRIIVKDNPKLYKKALRILSDTDTVFTIEDVAIMEMIHVLESIYGYSRTEISDAVNLLSDMNNLRLNRPVFASVVPLYLAHPKLSFNDCYLAIMSKYHSAEPLFTFDKKLAAQLPSAKLA